MKLEQNERYDNDGNILVAIYRSDLNGLLHGLGVRERLLQDIKSTLAKLTDENTYRICEKSESMNDAIHNLIESIKGVK